MKHIIIIFLTLMLTVGVVNSQAPIKRRPGKTEQPQTPTPQPEPTKKPSQTKSTPSKPTNNSSKPKLDPVIQNLLSNMVYVEGGTFSMGADDSDAFDDEKPVHQESVGPFHIGKYEVTQKEWKAVMGSNPSYYEGDDLPVECVSWDDCQEFIKKLNKLTGKNFRLPTEAEWEYAARGGRRSEGYKYSGSNTIGNVAWYDGNSGNETHTVGAKSPNELGLHDMSGNVLEWTSSHWSNNYNSPRNSSCFVIRGANWSSDARHCRVSNRDLYDRAHRYIGLGLRLVIGVERVRI